MTTRTIELPGENVVAMIDDETEVVRITDKGDLDTILVSTASLMYLIQQIGPFRVRIDTTLWRGVQGQ